MIKIEELLLENLTESQRQAVTSKKRRVLVVAGAGSGKTEVMARRIAWWIGVEKVDKKNIVAFTFTDRAAQEMKYRIRRWLEEITQPGEEVSLGGMYVGTIHGFCLVKLREYWPDNYHNYDILDESAKVPFLLRGYNQLLGLKALQDSLGKRQFETLESFIQAYDQLHENNRFDVEIPVGNPPYNLGQEESEWCKRAILNTDVGEEEKSQAFAVAAARYYAYLRCRRFLDFSTSQSEFVSNLKKDEARLEEIFQQRIHLVVDEVQDINPIQRELIHLLVDNKGVLTAVGDHRQSIYGFRGAKVEIVGKMWNQFRQEPDSEVVDLKENFRSTPEIIDLANRWSQTIKEIGSMKTAPMKHGNKNRCNQHLSHFGLVSFPTRREEAAWIAEAIHTLVPEGPNGALHEKHDGSDRGLTLSDVAVMVRSSTDVRTYMSALEDAGIPFVVRAGPDLFSQPEVLLFISALAITAGLEYFWGRSPKSLPERIRTVLDCEPQPEYVLHGAAEVLRKSGLTFGNDAEERLLLAAKAIKARLYDNQKSPNVSKIRNPKLKKFLLNSEQPRRVFPQWIYHILLTEAEIGVWDKCEGRGQTAMFHLGALSNLIKGLETPGWTDVQDYYWQIISLCQFGSKEGRTEEQTLLVKPDAVNIMTVHAAKGLEYAAVFIADVNARRFPSNQATRKPSLPFSGNIINDIDVAGLADNDNHDCERRLMYVALTRAERFLFISHSGNQTSKFVKEMKKLIPEVGGLVTEDKSLVLRKLEYKKKEHQKDIRIATSFSDLRYYLECPHDFYLRKVLGFSPAIDQVFGYGRGVHNLMRAVHANPKKWADLAKNRDDLEKELTRLVQQGLFYLRYTTGEPAEKMRRKGVRIVADYIQRFAVELTKLTFEPEKEFESLIDYEGTDGGVLISGAIDVVRKDDPPKVAIIDFKSGDPVSDLHQKLDEEQMRLQIGLYAAAAKKELEYEPNLGLVRYLDPDDPKDSEMVVPLNDEDLKKAKMIVGATAKRIRDRLFSEGPKSAPKDPKNKIRCEECDFAGFCGMEIARK